VRLFGGTESFYAVYFRMSEERFPYITGDVVDVVAACSVSEWGGKPQLSVKIKDLRLTGVPQESVLLGREWYSRFLDGKIACPVNSLFPEREDFALLYRYLRTAGGFRYGVEELFFRVFPSGMEYAKMLVALDVLEEMGLIARRGREEQAPIRLVPTQSKVNMDNSKILMKLKS